MRVTDEGLRIEFVNSSCLVISLRNKDYTGPEAINYTADDGSELVA